MCLCQPKIFISGRQITYHGRDNKVCYIRLEGRIFGDVPINLELRLSVRIRQTAPGV